MNYYEHTLIARHDLPENQTEKLVEKYEEIINKNSGKIIKTESWGLRNLSHEIKNNKKGFYFHIKLEGIGETVEKLEKAEVIDDKLLRFITVKVKKHNLNEAYFEKKETKRNIEKK